MTMSAYAYQARLTKLGKTFAVRNCSLLARNIGAQNLGTKISTRKRALQDLKFSVSKQNVQMVVFVQHPPSPYFKVCVANLVLKFPRKRGETTTQPIG